MSAETDATQVRDAIRASVAARKVREPSKKVWSAPAAEDFAFGTVLAFDQTITKTGVALVDHDYTGIHVRVTNLIKPVAGDHLRGFEQTLTKSLAMERGVCGVLLMLGKVDAIVHEMPSVMGYRIESSLLAAHSVRSMASQHSRGVPVHMVSNQAMRAVLNAPDQRDEKKYVKAAVEALVDMSARGPGPWNQDVHDAVGLALTYLHKQKVNPR